MNHEQTERQVVEMLSMSELAFRFILFQPFDPHSYLLLLIAILCCFVLFWLFCVFFEDFEGHESWKEHYAANLKKQLLCGMAVDVDVVDVG